jgi:hypothetical protein
VILDKNLQFDPLGTAITATAVSTNVIDLLNAREMATDQYGGFPIVTLTLGATFTAAGAATLTVQVQGSVDNVTYATLDQTDAIGKAVLLVGVILRIPLGKLQPQSAGINRYYRLNYVVATGPFTAGTLEADLVIGAEQLNNQTITYPPGVVVSN